MGSDFRDIFPISPMGIYTRMPHLCVPTGDIDLRRFPSRRRCRRSFHYADIFTYAAALPLAGFDARGAIFPTIMTKEHRAAYMLLFMLLARHILD